MLNTAEVPHWENQILGARSEKEANASCVTTSRNDIRMTTCHQCRDADLLEFEANQGTELQRTRQGAAHGRTTLA